QLHAFGAFEQILAMSLLRRPDFVPSLPLHRQPDAVFAQVLRHFNIELTESIHTDPRLARLVLPTVRAEFDMATGYRYLREPPLAAPAAVFSGARAPYVTASQGRAWAPRFAGGLAFPRRPCGHFLLVEARDFLLDTIRRTPAGAERALPLHSPAP